MICLLDAIESFLNGLWRSGGHQKSCDKHSSRHLKIKQKGLKVEVTKNIQQTSSCEPGSTEFEPF